MTTELNFDDLTPIEDSFSFRERDYVLCEATGDAACIYRNALLACTKLGPEGKPSSVEGMADAEPLLVSLCLFEVKSDGKRFPVTGVTVRSWPHRVQKRLFAKAQEISDLEEEETLEDLLKQRDEIDKKITELKEGSAKNG